MMDRERARRMEQANFAGKQTIRVAGVQPIKDVLCLNITSICGRILTCLNSEKNLLTFCDMGPKGPVVSTPYRVFFGD